ncbi:beta-glucanase [Flammeovirga pectinis]|uniref:Beta-glucanase n=1 Tax=Flammeovirga pectinis TaxID=2494373 RepID=A0A3Q9FPP9_9BACT|nr:glycoside hydrolase family 43 protein [Flammeovirga pectinis]AZQ64688.1 beta-glucanase [Flammeovirga pectinis]
MRYSLIISLMFLFSCQEKVSKFIPAEKWLDNNGVHINAHGGGILDHENTYYWFGEHKVDGKIGNTAQVGVHCYSSKDLYNWKDEGIALSVSNDTTSLLIKGCVIERPKVIYNAKNKQFVMWFHHELKGQGYKAAMTGVAVSDQITGPYQYLKSVNPNSGIWPIDYPDSLKTKNYNLESIKKWSKEYFNVAAEGVFLQRDLQKGQMARDMTLYVDVDGKAYHIFSSEENTTLHIAELTDNYQDFTGKYTRALEGQCNEAPAIFKKGEKYYMITSGLTGWKPNAARSAVADHPLGPWTSLGNPCQGTEGEKNTTFQSQSTFILPVEGKEDTYIFMADRWMPENAIDGRYIWLPIEFEEDKPVLKWQNEWHF